MNNPDITLEVKSVSKIFKDFWRRPKVTAVNDISFQIKRGEIFGLLGPNGSGKSTTIKMILGLLYPTRGIIDVLGRSPRDVKVKRRIGYLPEESYLYPYLSSAETLDFYGRLFDLKSSERKRRMDQLLDMIGLKHARRRIVGEFSKGMARRIGLAQSLINDPDFIILDEPTSGLDPLGCRQVKDLILTLAKRGKTILLTSHLLADVEDLCDRVAILYNGSIQAQGTIDALLEETTRFRLTLPPNATPDHLRTLENQIQTLTGEKAHIDHPRRDLEQFFLHVVEHARRQSGESSGVGGDSGTAKYLAADSAETSGATGTSSAPKSRKDIDEALNTLVKKQNDPDR
ncbi:MAG TPA: ABC transporter ATP-binding protein [Kiritimatiellia bacterium]|nr:ABC transporter ATP-binding protein [Kiritimatiellia bacterium]